MKWIKILDKIPDKGKTITIEVSNKKVCIVNLENGLSVFTAKCPHAGANLSNGWYEEGFWVCPIHRFKYNLINGRGAEGQGDYLKIYPIEIRKEGVFIGLEKSWWNLF